MAFSDEQREQSTNLLLFYNIKRNLSMSTVRSLPELYQCVRAVVSILVVTMTIQTLFSSRSANKTMGRSRLNDSTVASILHTQDLESSLDSEAVCKRQFKLNYARALTLTHKLAVHEEN